MRSYLLLILIFVSLLGSFNNICYSQVTVSDGNISARVESGSGLLSIISKRGLVFYSYPQHSYFTVKIDGRIFTNNPFSLQKQDTLKDAKVQQVKDTIFSTWKLNHADIIQKVFPLVKGNTQQIAVQFYIVNRIKIPVSISSQYLLDILLNGDGAAIAIGGTYSRECRQYTSFDTNSIGKNPYTFLTTYSNTFFPDTSRGPIGIGDIFGAQATSYPTRVTISDWNLAIDSLMGPFSPLPSEYSDAAILMEWSNQSCDSGQTIMIGGFTYGYVIPHILRGKDQIIAVYQDTWSTDSDVTANPKKIPISFFKQFEDSILMARSEVISLDNKLPIFLNGKLQKQATTIWNDSFLHYSTYNINFSSLNCINDTTFLTYCSKASNNEPLDTLLLPLYFTCNTAPLPQDSSKPLIKELGSSMAISRSFKISDSSITDKGIKAITLSGDTGLVQANISSLLADTCDRHLHTLTLTQKDTLKECCIMVHVVDCSNNQDSLEVCFPGRVFANVATRTQSPFTICPNPSRGGVTITQIERIPFSITVTDAIGKVVLFKEYPYGSSRVQLSLLDQPNGTYQVKLVSTSRWYSFPLIISR